MFDHYSYRKYNSNDTNILAYYKPVISKKPESVIRFTTFIEPTNSNGSILKNGKMIIDALDGDFNSPTLSRKNLRTQFYIHDENNFGILVSSYEAETTNSDNAVYDPIYNAINSGFDDYLFTYSNAVFYRKYSSDEGVLFNADKTSSSVITSKV